jgi:uncharacterized cupin superfamily protein
VSEQAFAIAGFERASSERFQRLRDALGIRGFGLNVLVFQPGERGRIHAHVRQEEVYVVLDGELTVILDGAEHTLARDQLVRVAPATRRQLANRGSEPLVLLAIGCEAPDHAGRDGLAWTEWEDTGPGAPPQDVPAPPSSER